MAIIALPVTTRFLRKIEWELDRPAQVNVSGYTGRRQVVANPWHGKWSASCEFAPIVGEANVLAWRAFFVRLKGQINTFRLPAVEGAQISFAIHAQGAQTVVNSITLGDFPTDGLAYIKAGHMMTINDQLVVVTADAVPVGGSANLRTVAFEPPLRNSAVTHLQAIEAQIPTALVALTDSSFGYSVDPGKIYGMAMKVEEAF